MAEKIISSASHKVTNEVIFKLITERINKKSLILDFGAGQGHMCQKIGDYFLHKGIDPKDRIFACEIVPEIFKYTKIKCQKISKDSVIPFQDKTFDLIYTIEALEHFKRPYDFFDEAYKKLNAGGYLIFSVPNILHFKSRLNFLLTGFGNMFGPSSIAIKNAGRICGHIMPLNYAFFNYGLRNSGFQNLKFHSDRRKRSSLFLSCIFYPFLKLGSIMYEKSLKKYDYEVWEENREVVYKMNSLDMLSSISCIMVAQKNSLSQSP